MEMERRRFIALSGSMALTAFGGCLHSSGYDAASVRQEAEVTPYEEMEEGDRIHVERGRVRQVQAADTTRYFIQTEQENGEWTNDVFGAWDGEEFEEGDTVEFWGVVEGFHETEEGGSIPDVTIVDMRSAE